MSAECAVCYVADLGFLLPSLASAARVREFVSPDAADVLIFTIGVEDALTDEINGRLSNIGVRLIPLDDTLFEKLDKAELAKTYTPMGTFGRFFMEEALPPSCRRLVYLDGDVWPVRDPSPLIEAVIPAGRFAAVDDTLFYRQNLGFGHTARAARDYFTSLGLNPGAGYFNAGIFAVERDTWRDIAKASYAFFLDNTALCKNFDQSALNVVVGDRRLRLSSKWNFQTQFKVWGADSYVSPHIYHFNRNPKPWRGPILPWPGMFEVYKTAFAALGDVGLSIKLLSPEETSEVNTAFRKAYAYLDLPLLSRAALAAMKFRQIERTAWM